MWTLQLECLPYLSLNVACHQAFVIWKMLIRQLCKTSQCRPILLIPYQNPTLAFKYQHQSHQKKPVCIEDAFKITVADNSFPELQFLLEKHNFVFGNKSRELFFLKWQTHYAHYPENVCKMPTLSSHSLLVILATEKGVL